MVKAYYRIDNDQYTYLCVSGHAQYDNSGKDLVCAGVSSIIFGLMNALDQSGEDIVINQMEDEIVIINKSQSEVVKSYFELTMYQLKTIEESYGDYLKVERK